MHARWINSFSPIEPYNKYKYIHCRVHSMVKLIHIKSMNMLFVYDAIDSHTELLVCRCCPNIASSPSIYIRLDQYIRMSSFSPSLQIRWAIGCDAMVASVLCSLWPKWVTK